jgi:hypothetical protein
VVARLQIQDGSPVWASAAIVPSRDTVVSPASSPSLATINVGSTGIFVYAKVDNIGDVDLGACNCSPVPAPWPVPTFFANFFANASGGTIMTQGSVTFNASPLGDSLSGSVSHSFGLSASGRRAWAWSPDGRLFAYVGSPNGNDWFLTIVPLVAFTRANGTTVAAGGTALQANGLFSGPFTNANFAWAGSLAVIAAGQSPAGGLGLTVACPASPGGASYGDLIPLFAGQVDYTFLASPCGGVVAIVPKILNSSAGSRDAFQISTATAGTVPFKSNGMITSVTIVGPNPAIRTINHAARGVQVNTGSGATVDVDDPDCTFVGGGVRVTVDRVKASTLPSANLGVVPVGTGSVVGSLLRSRSAWAQVVNSNGWANASEKHWCLLAQAYTADGTTIPRPWNGQAASPPPFPVSLVNCAQRNIEINP